MNDVVRSKSLEDSRDLLTTIPVVYVVDDNTDVLGSRRFLLETDGFQVRTFRSGEALLNTTTIGLADCLVIDYKDAEHERRRPCRRFAKPRDHDAHHSHYRLS